jgi:predicted nuclease of restriction endonuclease-like (RecB) superfamily
LCIAIRDAIIRSRYQAARLVNKELLSLYYGVGKYISENSRGDYWGKGAIMQLSEDLQRELPGLRGFSEGQLKKMRLFYEEWSAVFSNRSSAMNDLIAIKPKNRSSSMNELQIPAKMSKEIDLDLLLKHLNGFVLPNFATSEFLQVGFTHQYTIISQEKSLEGRLFYISRCASEFWSVEALKSNLRGDLYSKKGTLPSNFLQTLPEPEQARRAIRAFKEEYFLDYINIEDENDPDERLLENGIVANIKQFILTFGGNKFCFMGHQCRVIVEGEEFFIDLLFFHRELRCLVAVELKRGKFKPSYLGQLHFYLSALDEYVRQDDEAPSIGILLCKEATRSIVEFAVRDYSKPMGVATYKTRNDMPEQLQKALPDVEEMRQILDSSNGYDITAK